MRIVASNRLSGGTMMPSSTPRVRFAASIRSLIPDPAEERVRRLREEAIEIAATTAQSPPSRTRVPHGVFQNSRSSSRSAPEGEREDDGEAFVHREAVQPAGARVEGLQSVVDPAVATSDRRQPGGFGGGEMILHRMDVVLDVVQHAGEVAEGAGVAGARGVGVEVGDDDGAAG